MIRPVPSVLPMDVTQRYYVGLPSCPLLVGRSSCQEWEEPEGLEAYGRRKSLLNIGDHAISNEWPTTSTLIVQVLRTAEVAFTSIDVVRIGFRDEENYKPLVWIGVEPDTLRQDRGNLISTQIKNLLDIQGVSDIEVEMREAVVTASAGGPFLSDNIVPVPEYVESVMNHLQDPFRFSAGLSIASLDTPYLEGTGGFFLRHPGGQLLMVTCRHVVTRLGSPGYENVPIVYDLSANRPRPEIIFLGSGTLKKATEAIDHVIELRGGCIKTYETRLNRLKATGQPDVTSIAPTLDQFLEVDRAMKEFRHSIETNCGSVQDRVIGRLLYAPPFGLMHDGSHSWLRDYAVIEIDQDKIVHFLGNSINLRGKFDSIEATRALSFDSEKRFSYPASDFLPVVGIIPNEDLFLSSAKMLRVVKRGSGSGVTFGRINEIPSVVRRVMDRHNPHLNFDSTEWLVVPICQAGESHRFSEGGDSGAAVVDSDGRIGGMLTGGSGHAGSYDTTYATSVDVIVRDIAKQFPGVRLA